MLSALNHYGYKVDKTSKRRRSENDNTPQPLDQWTISPFIGQQVGNCKSFTLTHYWADLFAMHSGIVHPTSYPTHIPFIPCGSTLPFLSYSNFNVLPSKSKVKVMGEGKVESHNILLSHIPFIPCQLAIPFLRYNFFKIWPWKSKVKVMEEVNIESHNMGPTFYRLTSLLFYVNQPSHS